MRGDDGDGGGISERTDCGGNRGRAGGKNRRETVVVDGGDVGGGRSPGHSTNEVLNRSIAVNRRSSELLADADGECHILRSHRNGGDAGSSNCDRTGLGNAAQGCSDGCGTGCDSFDQTGHVHRRVGDCGGGPGNDSCQVSATTVAIGASRGQLLSGIDRNGRVGGREGDRGEVRAGAVYGNAGRSGKRSGASGDRDDAGCDTGRDSRGADGGGVRIRGTPSNGGGQILC